MTFDEKSREKVARLVSERGKPKGKKASPERGSDQGVTITAERDVNFYTLAPTEPHTRVDRRLAAGKRKRRAETKVKPGYVNRRYVATSRAQQTLTRRKADQIEAEENLRNRQTWLVLVMIMGGCIVGLILIVELVGVR